MGDIVDFIPNQKSRKQTFAGVYKSMKSAFIHNSSEHSNKYDDHQNIVHDNHHHHDKFLLGTAQINKNNFKFYIRGKILFKRPIGPQEYLYDIECSHNYKMEMGIKPEYIRHIDPRLDQMKLKAVYKIQPWFRGNFFRKRILPQIVKEYIVIQRQKQFYENSKQRLSPASTTSSRRRFSVATNDSNISPYNNNNNEESYRRLSTPEMSAASHSKYEYKAFDRNGNTNNNSNNNNNSTTSRFSPTSFQQQQEVSDYYYHRQPHNNSSSISEQRRNSNSSSQIPHPSSSITGSVKDNYHDKANDTRTDNLNPSTSSYLERRKSNTTASSLQQQQQATSSSAATSPSTRKKSINVNQNTNTVPVNENNINKNYIANRSGSPKSYIPEGKWLKDASTVANRAKLQPKQQLQEEENDDEMSWNQASISTNNSSSNHKSSSLKSQITKSNTATSTATTTSETHIPSTGSSRSHKRDLHVDTSNLDNDDGNDNYSTNNSNNITRGIDKMSIRSQLSPTLSQNSSLYSLSLPHNNEYGKSLPSKISSTSNLLRPTSASSTSNLQRPNVSTSSTTNLLPPKISSTSNLLRPTSTSASSTTAATGTLISKYMKEAHNEINGQSNHRMTNTNNNNNTRTMSPSSSASSLRLLKINQPIYKRHQQQLNDEEEEEEEEDDIVYELYDQVECKRMNTRSRFRNKWLVGEIILRRTLGYRRFLYDIKFLDTGKKTMILYRDIIKYYHIVCYS